MEAITIGQIISWISDFGVIALFIILLVTGMRGDWVFGWVHRDLVQRITADNVRLQNDNQKYINLALNGTLLANKAITLAEAPQVEQNNSSAPLIDGRRGAIQ